MRFFERAAVNDRDRRAGRGGIRHRGCDGDRQFGRHGQHDRRRRKCRRHGCCGAGRDGWGAIGGGGRAGAQGGTTGTAGAFGGAAGGSEDGVHFTPNKKISDSGSGAENMVAAGPDGLLLAGWYAGGVCQYTFSADTGTTWAKNFRIGPMNGDITGDCSVAIGGDGRMYALAQDYGTSQIRLETSTDKGANWSMTSNVHAAPDKPWIGASPSKPGVAFVTWLGNTAGVVRTEDGGTTWGAQHPLEFLNHGTTIGVGSDDSVHIAFSPNGGQIR